MLPPVHQDASQIASANPPPPIRSTLFRPEVIEAQLSRSAGSVLILNPVGHTVLVGIFGTLAVLLVVFVFTFGFHRKVTVQGVIAPDLGLISIRAAGAGVITARLIVEGQRVRQGDAMFRVSGERASAALGDTESALSDLLQQRRASLTTDLSRLEQQITERHVTRIKRLDEAIVEGTRLDAEVLLQQRRVDLAQADYQRALSLRAQGFLSEVGLQEKEATLLDQQLRAKELAGSKQHAARDRADLAGDVSSDADQAVRDTGAVNRAISEVDTELARNEAGRAFMINAPIAGSIDLLEANVGDPVSVSQPLAAMMPANAQLEAMLYAPSSAAGFIRPGMQVLLRYQSFPFQKFGQARGRVTAVADAAVGGSAGPLADTRSVDSEPVYRVRVALEHQDVAVAEGRLPLKAGMRLEASVVLEQRRLIEWILEPLDALRGRL